MIKIFFSIIVFTLSISSSLAHENLVLSDIIREAREAQLRQAAAERLENNLTPIQNNETIDTKSEKTATEKINTKERLKECE